MGGVYNAHNGRSVRDQEVDMLRCEGASPNRVVQGLSEALTESGRLQHTCGRESEEVRRI